MMLREDFPALSQRIHGHRLAYLDSASTTQKPRAVLEAMERFHREACANVHRGVHTLSERATAAYDEARAVVQRFIGAEHVDEVIFTRGTTESLNLVAHSFARSTLEPGDEVLVTAMEHHSNIVPWRMVCDERGAYLKVLPVSDTGELAPVGDFLSPRTRIVAVSHVSNALGTVNAIADIVAKAHAAGAVVVVDGAQAIAHAAVDVRQLGCDFYAFSGHKVYAPTGIGVLYGRRSLLARMPPWQGGGDMIDDVTFDRITYAEPPARFEAGSPNVAAAVGLGVALQWLARAGREALEAHEARVLDLLCTELAAMPRVKLIGTPRARRSVVSFVVDGVHPHDVGTVLDSHGVALRAGHHCAQPLMARLGLDATVRASVAAYTDDTDVMQLIDGLRRVMQVFRE